MNVPENKIIPPASGLSIRRAKFQKMFGQEKFNRQTLPRV
jgi:hypothetical protein